MSLPATQSDCDVYAHSRHGDLHGMLPATQGRFRGRSGQQVAMRQQAKDVQPNAVSMLAHRLRRYRFAVRGGGGIILNNLKT